MGPTFSDVRLKIAPSLDVSNTFSSRSSTFETTKLTKSLNERIRFLACFVVLGWALVRAVSCGVLSIVTGCDGDSFKTATCCCYGCISVALGLGSTGFTEDGGSTKSCFN